MLNSIPFAFVQPVNTYATPANPFGSLMNGVESGIQTEQQMRQNALRNAMLANQAKYQPQILAQQLQNWQIKNKYDPLQDQADINYKNSQIPLTNAEAYNYQQEAAKTALANQQTQRVNDWLMGGQSQTTPSVQQPNIQGASGSNFLPQQQQMQQMRQNALAQELMKASYIPPISQSYQQVAQQNPQIAQQPPQLNQQANNPGAQPIAAGYNNSLSPLQQMPGATTQITVPGNPGMYGLDARVASAPGIIAANLPDKLQIKTTEKTDPTTGQLIVTKQYPSGRVETSTFPMGASPQDVAESKETGKKTADFIDTLNTRYLSNQDVLNNLGMINDTVKNNPNVFQGIGPIKSKEALIDGDPQLKANMGTIMTASGNLVAAMAQKFKGQFRKGEQGLIMGMKPNLNDQGPVFQAKVDALQTLAQFDQQHISAEHAYLRINKGSDPLDAMAYADSKYNIHNAISAAQAKINAAQQQVDAQQKTIALQKSLSVPPNVNSQNDFRNHFSSLSPAQQQSMLNIYNQGGA